MSMPAPAPHRSSWASELAPALFVAAPLALLLAFVLWSTGQRRNDLAACLAAGTPRTVAQGLLRQAGADFFVQSDGSWRRITHACAGRMRSECLQHCPGNAALEQHLGQPLRVEFCGAHAVAFELAGRRYAHPALSEPHMRMCG